MSAVTREVAREAPKPTPPALYAGPVATDLLTVLLPQWQTSPLIRRLVTDSIGHSRDTAIDVHDAIKPMLSVDTATGIWLDILGTRYGLSRPISANPSADPRFGFDAAGVGFDQEPFRGAPENDALFPLNDDQYRQLIRARGILVHSDGTIATFLTALREIDPEAIVIDSRDMTLQIISDHIELVQLADSNGALPRSGGIQIEYVADAGPLSAALSVDVLLAAGALTEVLLPGDLVAAVRFHGSVAAGVQADVLTWGGEPVTWGGEALTWGTV